MRRTVPGLVILALLLVAAFPALAAKAPTSACAGATLPATAGLGQAVEPAVPPLTPEERLLYSLTGLAADAPLEIRYLVNGRELATEHLDLARQEAPAPARNASKALRKNPEALDLESLTAPGRDEVERATELLALRPDLVRQLAARAQSGATVRIEVSHGGALVETVPFAKLRERSAALLAGRTMPVMVPSRVNGAESQDISWLSSVVAPKYLPDCNDCTTSTPCEEECGYDPGKGGPTTCGEYGGICQQTCPCSYTIGNTYGGWSYYSSYYSGYSTCKRSSTAGLRWHDEIVKVYRRNVYQNDWVCSACPSCDGCHVQQTLTGYQYAYTSCWNESFSSCFSGSQACCSTLCFLGNDCNWGC
jgi:hypothetical protein